MIPEIGQRFGPYEILGKLGGGGMGHVFRAWDQRLCREVAIKLLNDDYTMPGMRERFLQEARAASALNHPNICTVFDIGEQDNNPYLVMELLEGETVKDRIVYGSLLAEDIARYAIEIVDALAVANAKGIVHRDIKPANIFLVKLPNGKSQAKVLDFGLAKVGVDKRGGWDARSQDLTRAGSTVGTLAYMSPEQARGEPLDLRSDLFSLGIVLYEMATRQVPFQGATSALLFVQLFHHDPEPVRNWNEAIPRELEKVILRLLEKDQKKRFQTAKELHDELVKVSSKLGRGGWLSSKGEALGVPLVRTSDPTGRKKSPKRTPLQAADSGSSSGSRVIRPMRVQGGDRGGAEAAMRRLAKEGVVAVESGEMPALLPTVNGVAAESGTIDVAGQREVALARPQPTTTPFGYDLEKGLFSEEAIESADDHGVRELITVSKTISAKTQLRMMIAAALIVVGVAAVALVRGGIFRPFVLGANDHLLLTVIENKTGDKTLDGTVMQGLEIALQQSRTLNLFGGAAYGAGLRQVASDGGASAGMVPEQRVAQQVGAKAYLYGEIRGSTAPYTISVDVLKSNSNDKVETLEEEAGSRAEITAAIGRLAQDIRVEVSEDKKAEERSTVPFELDATANLNALHAYAVGEVAMRNGHTKDAIVAYQQAVVFDPKFAQALMRLAWLYRSEKAEVGAANAAEMAQKAAAKASNKVKLLAQFCYEMNVSGNLEQAATTIRQYVARYPQDEVGMKGLARVLRMQGNLQQALTAAQSGFEANPFDTEVYTEAELAMIGMDHYDGALQLETQAEHIGVASSGTKLTAAYLAGKEEVTLAQANAMQAGFAGMTATNGTPITYAELYRYGLYLDNAGKIGAGSELWRVSAGVASSVPGLDSTQASMLAQGALDRALMESCTGALEMVGEVKELPKGPVASFNAGMAAALCGDQMYAYKTMATLQKNYPQNTAVTQYYVPQLQAAAEIGANEPAKALDALIALEEYDQVSLTPYLRGMANSALGQMPAAILDFQVVLDHRGTSFTIGSNAYPMAEVGTARAYTANHDKTSSVETYRRFLTLWGGADPDQALLKEALTKTGADSSAHR